MLVDVCQIKMIYFPRFSLILFSKTMCVWSDSSVLCVSEHDVQFLQISGKTQSQIELTDFCMNTERL